MKPLRITPDQITFTDGKVVYASHDLTNRLIQQPQDVLKLFGLTGAEVSLEQVSVDDAGNVVVDNPALGEAIQKLLAQAQQSACIQNEDRTELNVGCGFGC